eukprot:SAG31_NODE_4969_length_2828_cov_1.631000_2_plen_209_part_00
MTTYYRAIRIHTEQSEEHKIRQLCNLKNTLYYVYGFEISKKDKRPHFHIVLKGTRVPKTVTDDIKKIFNITDSRLWSNCEIKTTNTQAIAYCMKDGNYNIHWDNDKEIDDALKACKEYKEEQHFKTLKGKTIYHLNKLPKSGYMTNTVLMYNILNIFKEKQLAYPSQAWIKNCMVTYYMQEPNGDMVMKNIETLYNIRDPWLEDNKNI